MTASIVLTQDEFRARHGSCLVELRGLRLLSLAEMGAGAAFVVDDDEAADEAVNDAQHARYTLEGYSGLRHLSLCRVRGDLEAGYEHMPALPAGLQELTLDSGPARPPAGGDGAAEHRPRGLDLRHLTALTRLTLVALTAALLSEDLLGPSNSWGPGQLRLPPWLRVLSLREPGCAGGEASSVYLSRVLHTMREAPPPVRLPALHVRAITVQCCPLELWSPLSDTGLPESFRVQTQHLCLSMTAALRWAGHAVCGHRMGGLTPDETSSVRPAEALCQLLGSMPFCVKDFGLGCIDRQPLCLRLEWCIRSAARVQPRPCHHEVSYATAADLADSLQPLADEYGLCVRVNVEDGDDYVVVSRVANAANAARGKAGLSCALR